MSLFKPFQNLKGSNATIELFLKIGQTFTASQLGLINDLVVKFSNKKLLHQWRAQCMRQKKQFQLSFIYIDLQENPYDYYVKSRLLSLKFWRQLIVLLLHRETIRFIRRGISGTVRRGFVFGWVAEAYGQGSIRPKQTKNSNY